MADFQSSVCDISATASCFHRARHARFLPLFAAAFDDPFAIDLMDDREDYGE